MPCGCTQVLEPDPAGQFTICDNAGSLGFTERGNTPLASGASTKMVAFTVAKATAEYSFTELDVENLVDPNSFNIDAEVTARTVNGFTVQLSGLPDTANYTLRWNVYVASM